MIRRCYKLTFEGPFHVSSGGFAMEGSDALVRSDTLFSALCATAADLWGDTDVLARFFFPENGQPPAFRLSSAFPYFDDQFFLPKPFFFKPDPTLSHKAQKDLKKARFVEASIWEGILYNATPPDFKPAPMECPPQKTGFSTIKNGCWTNKPWPQAEERRWGDALYVAHERPRVTVDRVSNAGTIYHFGEITFNEGAGLFFMADFEREADATMFDQLLRLLGDNGLGSDRTIGRGQFTVDLATSPIPIPDEADSEAFVCLSLFVPSPDELDALQWQRSWYDFTVRRGWVSNRELRRRSVRMFSEGSAFCWTASRKTPRGRLLNTLDPSDFEHFPVAHPVWRSGLCFAVPIGAAVLGDAAE